MRTAFPSLEDLQEYEVDLANDAYSNIPKTRFRNCSYIVFDDKTGQTLYASDSHIADRIRVADLIYINDSDRNGYYTVSQVRSEEGDLQYRICLEYYNPDTGFTEELGYCLTDQNLQILSGDLFNLPQLTVEAFQFIQGLYHSDDTINKYSFQSSRGDWRTVVFIAPQYTETAYNQALAASNQIYLILIPVILTGSILFTVLFLHRIKRMLMTMNRGIQTYRSGDAVPVDRSQIAVEFQDTLDAMDHLLAERNAAERERQQMIAGLSHDLKTPLSVINGCARAFTEGLVPTEQSDKYMRMIVQRSQMAADLINTLFLCTKMDHPDFQPQLEEVDFCEYVKEFLAEKYDEIETAEFELSVQLECKKSFASIDSGLFRRVLENLLANALKYNQAGTTLYVNLEQNEEQLCLTFADDGVGISPELADHIFEAFVTGDKARSGGKGTGLGLSIVKKVVALHHGEINLVIPPESNYATEFQIRLPLIQP